MKVGLRREDVLCQSKRIVGVYQIATTEGKSDHSLVGIIPNLKQ